MSYEYWLPGDNNSVVNNITETNSVIIIGANGSGKSKLGAWIEKQDEQRVHRISAQRKLNFSNHVPLKSYQHASNMVLYGTNEETQVGHKNIKWDWNRQLTTKLVDDFDDALAAIIAKKNLQNDEFVDLFNKRESHDRHNLNKLHTVIDELLEIWDDVFPHRGITIKDAMVKAHKKPTIQEYSGVEMSDGERVALYLIAQCLSIPENKIVIIDEPELHLHPSIMNRVWLNIERRRMDCLFIYITHDMEFASIHSSSDKIWLKDYDGQNWNYSHLTRDEHNEGLSFEILGNRKDIIFVEGEISSYDAKLYTKIYSNYYVVPCGSCTQVIQKTKAYNNSEQLHHLNVYGIIDRDYRTENELLNLKSDGIYTIDVAEVENLFITEEVLQIIDEHLGFANNDSRVGKVKTYIINDRYKEEIANQINNSIISELKHKLSTATIDASLQSMETIISNQDFEQLNIAQNILFNKAMETNDYNLVLKLFNRKELGKSIGHHFGLQNKDYYDFVLRLFDSDKYEEICEALKKYLPNEIQI